MLFPGTQETHQRSNRNPNDKACLKASDESRQAMKKRHGWNPISRLYRSSVVDSIDPTRTGYCSNSGVPHSVLERRRGEHGRCRRWVLAAPPQLAPVGFDRSFDRGVREPR
mmetsp:Transcript_5685/g.14194  ORF Transcript_5685/g.14194 Transcript_5685/m.14194 type:complete len:111 (-) Transcript_5685:228-560(-)